MKCKVIEESRFRKMENMEDVKGGITCTVMSPYSTSCKSWNIGYIICSAPSVSGGYSTSTCHGIGDLHTCGRDMNYNQSTCFGWGAFSVSCPATTTYQG